MNNFNEVRFPGDRRDCQKCHTVDANGVGTEQVFETPPDGLLPTTAPRDWYHADGPLHDCVPGLPRHQAGGGARILHDGALRRGLRHLPRSRRRLLRRQDACAVGVRSAPYVEGVNVKNRWVLFRITVIAAAALAASPISLRAQAPAGAPTPTPSTPAPQSATHTSGTPVCADCHEAEVKAFASNPHARWSSKDPKPVPRTPAAPVTATGRSTWKPTATST